MSNDDAEYFRDQWNYDVSKTIIPKLKVTTRNPVRELDQPTCIENLKLAPLDSPQALWNWLQSLLNVECAAWFASIGWPEGDGYWSNEKYFTTMVYPGFLDMIKRRLEC